MGPPTLIPSLEFLVPMRIRELQEGGGVYGEDFNRIRELLPDLLAHGDTLMYGSQEERDQYAVVDCSGRKIGFLARLVDAIAVLSFLPGGIDLFGNHWESTIAGSLRKDSEESKKKEKAP